MKKYTAPLMALGVVVLLVAIPVVTALSSRWFENKVDYAERKIDERTRYELLKQVEDTCRAMVVNYTADKLTYEQYRDSNVTEQRNWAAQAKMRANRTAASYNEYIMKNSFLWENSVPDDIAEELAYLE